MPKADHHKSEKKPDLPATNKDLLVPVLTTPTFTSPVAIAPMTIAPKSVTPVTTAPSPVTISSTIPDLVNFAPLVSSFEEATTIANATVAEKLDITEDSMNSMDGVDDERLDMIKQQRVFFSQDPFYNPTAQFIMMTARARAEREAERTA
jgi:hypothetical protein